MYDKNRSFLQDDELEMGIRNGEKHAQGTESGVAPKVITNYIWFDGDNTNYDDENGIGNDNENGDDNDDDVFAGWKIRTAGPKRQNASRRERVRHHVHGKLSHEFLYHSNVDNDDYDHDNDIDNDNSDDYNDADDEDDGENDDGHGHGDGDDNVNDSHYHELCMKR